MNFPPSPFYGQQPSQASFLASHPAFTQTQNPNQKLSVDQMMAYKSMSDPNRVPDMAEGMTLGQTPIPWSSFGHFEGAGEQEGDQDQDDFTPFTQSQQVRSRTSAAAFQPTPQKPSALNGLHHIF